MRPDPTPCVCVVITPTGKRRRCTEPATSEPNGHPVCGEHQEPRQ